MMTMPADDHAPESPLVGQVCREAQSMVEKVGTLLQAAGWHAIVISVSRVIEADGEMRAPGATATIVHPDVPIKRLVASVLRKQADVLERAAGDDDGDTSGYIQDHTDYASGMRKWPR